MQKIPTDIRNRQVGGGIDKVDHHLGIFGWLVDRNAVGRAHIVEMVCGGAVLATSITMLQRPDIDLILGRVTGCGLFFEWSRINQDLLTECALAKPASLVLFRLFGSDVYLEMTCTPLVASDLQQLSNSAPTRALSAETQRMHDTVDIMSSTVFDPQWYSEVHGIRVESELDRLVHYIDKGEALGLTPSLYFDPVYYAKLHGMTSHSGALATYTRSTSNLTERTSIHFDPEWYRSQTAPIAGISLLASFMQHRDRCSPNSAFDRELYLQRYPDVASFPDAYEHFYRYGALEDRVGSASFDAGYYRRMHLTGRSGVNPLKHYLEEGRLKQLTAVPFSLSAAGKSNRPSTRHTAAIQESELVRQGGQVSPASFSPMPSQLYDWSQTEAVAGALELCGLFDTEYYRKKNPGLDRIKNLALHFVEVGQAEGRKPNPYFDPAWYSKRYHPLPQGMGPLEHYLSIGEDRGWKPCAVFEPDWYRSTYSLRQGETCALAHYLMNRRTNRYSPNRYFSIDFYLNNNPDIATSALDGFEHWLEFGLGEGRKASEAFDAPYVRSRYLGNNRELHPFEVFMDLGTDLGWEGTASASSASVHREVKENTQPGLEYEGRRRQPLGQAKPSAKVIAFYLPQFHQIAENDEWWGTGFTEWRNVVRGTPRYRGHYQPRIPRDFGFYDLQKSPGTMRQQVELARSMGIHGFCFYYYNFNGRRLLDGPLDAFLADPEIDFPFCILWANENWTRRWDGMEQDILIAQNYRDGDRDALIDDISKYLHHRNYIHVGGRPLFGVYRADAIPDSEETIRAWRRGFRTRQKLDPFIAMAQTFNCNDPRPFGFDAALEFPPHKIGSSLRELNAEIELYDPAFSGSVRSYQDAIALSLSGETVDYPVIKTAFPMWDNDARKQGAGMSFKGATPIEFGRWMEGLVAHARSHPVGGERLVFVNAWNEWCEGAYLEPDCHYGYAFINALARAVLPLADGRQHEKVLLVGHDAFPAGAQQLLLNIGRTLSQQFGGEVAFLLMGDGAMVEAYEQVGRTHVATRHADADGAIKGFTARLHREGFQRAFTNSIFSGRAVQILKSIGYDVASLVHELPTIVSEHHGTDAYAAIRDQSDVVVFPSAFVHDEIVSAFGAPTGSVVIRPQGLYKDMTVGADARSRIRTQLGLSPADRIVINVGHGDLRKGVDVFVAVAAAVAKTRADVHFVWLGDHHPGVLTWLKRDIERRGMQNLHLLPFCDDVADHLAAADLFFISSREDPFPSVVLEALASGLPVLGFDGGGGHAALLADPELGRATAYLDVEAAARAIAEMLDDPREASPERRAHRRAFVRQQHDFPRYCASLLETLTPGRASVSVVVPNYNYAHYLGDRLASIFAQDHPVLEVVLLDDASTDASLAIAEETALRHERRLHIQANAENSGNVFRQWRKGLEEASGEFLWIAEADDLSAPTFLSRAIERLAADKDAAFAFCDSTAIDAAGDTLYDSYKPYYAQYGDHGLDEDATYDAAEFLKRFLSSRNLVLNASSVVWRTAHLKAAFDALGDDAFRLTCAGDWQIYAASCRQGGRVHYIADCLNLHRRHDSSVTHQQDKAEHLREIETMQEWTDGLTTVGFSSEETAYDSLSNP